jgi:hypothetical protein
MVNAQHTVGSEPNFLAIRLLYKVARQLHIGTKRKLMAAVMRVLLWALVLLAPGGLLLAPVLAAHELRRRGRANSSDAPQQASVPSPL